MQLFASANRDHDDENDDPDEDEEFSRRNDNQMESLGLVSEVINLIWRSNFRLKQTIAVTPLLVTALLYSLRFG